MGGRGSIMALYLFINPSCDCRSSPASAATLRLLLPPNPLSLLLLLPLLPQCLRTCTCTATTR